MDSAPGAEALLAHLDEFLRAPRPAVIGTVRSDGAPGSCGSATEGFMISTDEHGRRVRNLTRDGRVALTVMGEDWYDQVSLRGRVVEMRPDREGVTSTRSRSITGASRIHGMPSSTR